MNLGAHAPLHTSRECHAITYARPRRERAPRELLLMALPQTWLCPQHTHKTGLSFSLKVGLVHLRVLLGELEKHRVIKKLVDGHILGEALATPRLDHELAREVRRRLRLQRAQRDVLIERIARHDRPVVKDGEAECLPLRVGAQICLEAERVDHGHVCLDEVDGRPRARPLARHVPPAPREHRVDGRHAVDGRGDVDKEDGLHESGRGHQEGRVGDAARGGDDLPTAPMDRLRRDRRVQDLELDVSHRLVAEWTFAAAPLEAL